MSVIRVHKSKNFTVMSNTHLRDKDLSLKAKGLLSVMLSLPDDWNYSIAGLCSICKENETAVKSTIKELKEKRYVIVDKKNPNETKSKKYEYVYNIFEEPQGVDNQEVENLPLENLPLENRTLNKSTYVSNTDKINTDKINTDLQNTEKGDTTNKFVGEVDTSVSEQKPTAKSKKRTYSELKELETDMLKRVVKICDTNLGFSQSKTKEVLELFEYYFYKYTQKTGKIHPILTDSTLERIINELLAEREDDENHKYFGGILEYEGVAEAMIDTFFEKGLGDGTDYHLSHFATNGVLLNLGCRANLGEI
ncbi:MAG: helix-turn-helix domain-containing protein [Clostridiales bacterium]|nr:helix-turn-helix domain-containing protein [Clostridiales bacterium]